MSNNMDFLFGLLPDFYREFFEDKDMLLEIWDGYKGKFVDMYNRLYELANSISLPRAPYVHREYYGTLVFDLSTAIDATTYKIDSNIVKLEQLSEYPDPNRADFFLEEGKDYRIKIVESGDKHFEFLRTTKVTLTFTYNSPDYQTIPIGTKFFVSGSTRYVQIIGDGVGYYIRNVDQVTGEEISPLTTSTVLDIPSDLAYVGAVEISSVATTWDSYLDRIKASPVPKHLYAYRVSRDTQIIEKNFGSFIDYPNTRTKKDMAALRSTIYDGVDPSSTSFSLANDGLSVINNEIIHSADRWVRDLELYKLRVNALWFALWNGPSEFNLNIAASIFVGLPISELEGEVKSVVIDYAGRYVISITDGSVLKEYILPKDILPSVQVGDPIALFQPLASNAAEVYDVWIDESRFKTALQDIYSSFTSNMEESCGAIFDDTLSFDASDPCDRIYFDSCTPSDEDDLDLCYRDTDLNDSRYAAIIYAVIDSTHLKVSFPPYKFFLFSQVHDMTTGKVENVFISDYDYATGVVELYEPIEMDVTPGSIITEGKDQLFLIEDNLDCSLGRARACTTIYDDLNNPGSTIELGNYPEDFYRNFRYVFLLDVLGATSILSSDFEGLYNFLYRIKPAYAHFIVNMTVKKSENIGMEVDMVLATGVCELYDEKKVFFDNYLSDGPDSGVDLYDYAKLGKGAFFDDPRLCLVDIFDSGETETALTGAVEVQQTEITQDQIDLGSEPPSP